MRCDQIEQRLNELLDDRRPVHTDARLLEHQRDCPRCRAMIAGFAELQEGIDAAHFDRQSQLPHLSEGFAAAVVQQALTPPHRRRPAMVRPARWLAAAAAVAAVLLLAAWPMFSAWQASDQQPKKTARSEHHASAMESVPPSTKVDSAPTWDRFDPYEHVWLLTGRELATIPVRVRRRAADWSATGQLSVSLRPVAASVSATLDALFRVLPAEPTPPEIPNGDTGSYQPVTPSETA